MRAHVVERDPLGRAGQAENHVPGERLPTVVVHRGEPAGGGVAHGLGIVFRRAGAGEDVEIEGGEIHVVEPHAGPAVSHAPGEVRAGPVEHGHEVVADHLDSGAGEVPQALAVGLEMLSPVALLLLDVFRDRQALHHVPGEPGGRAVRPAADLSLPPGDLVHRPDRARGHVVQRRDHAFHPRLQHVVD